MKVSSERNYANVPFAENSIKNKSFEASVLEKNISGDVIFAELFDGKGVPTEQAYQVAVNKLNEFMELSQRNSKFIFHKDLERYYVEVVDAKTQEVIREIPPKELLDSYYEMQKVIGKIFDDKA